MDARVLRRFERLVDPYPAGEPAAGLPRRFGAFLWACTLGLRRYLLALVLLTAVLGVFEAFLFSMMGRVVDALAAVPPSQLWATHRTMLLALVLKQPDPLLTPAALQVKRLQRRQDHFVVACLLE